MGRLQANSNLSKDNKISIKKQNLGGGKIQLYKFLPNRLQGLALWLKADAGVNKISYNYVSQIIISGTSNPSFAGTYTADGVPTYNFEDGFSDAYSFTGPEGKTMSWSADDGYFLLSSSGEDYYSFYSYDGVNWLVYESYVFQIVITGFTGVYAGANGTYNGNGNYFTRVGGGFIINNNQLIEVDYEIVIATSPANYSGSWTPATYISSVTLAGANTTVVNGVYTRTDSELREVFITFLGSGGKNLYWNGDYWLAKDEENSYYLSDFDLITWTVSEYTEGTAPAPTGATATSARSVGNPTSTSSSKPTGSISGSGIITATVNTDYVDSWIDQSENGRNANANSESISNTLVAIGGKSFVSFTNSPMFIPMIWNEVPLIGTIFTVARFNSSSTEDYGSRIFLHEGNGDDVFFTRGRIGTNNFYFASVGDAVVSSVPLNNNTNYLIETTFDSSSASLFLNGTSVGTGPTEENIGEGEAFIGQGEPYKMAEMVVYNRVLTTEERQQVEAYLNEKYAIY